jgi:adenylyl-sulfate kinase
VRATGRFIVIDPISNETVGMISDTFAAKSQNRSVGGAAAGMVVWLTGLSSAGKSTIAQTVYEKLWAAGRKVELLDSDVVRQHLSKNLGFSKADRDENIARIGFVAELLARNGVIAIVAAISPYAAARQAVRERVGKFLEVYVHAPLAVLEERDRKGIYRRCRSGEIHGVSGIDDPYEPPVRPEVECQTDHETIAQSAAKVVHAIERRIAEA